MEIFRAQSIRKAFLALLLLALVAPSINAQSTAPAPAPTSDGVAIDQGIAYDSFVPLNSLRLVEIERNQQNSVKYLCSCSHVG
ncbi:hypothetical protein Tsubulata_033404 [Turnera subulata]|uniref:Uncharacterized protein n=1 Tax=Turnera subulata TaxID=218843 RepID=A0A9Q0GBG2_9ROSI|nr:hypothetical protein Tsubulata_033404 [Turnera subulata]